MTIVRKVCNTEPGIPLLALYPKEKARSPNIFKVIFKITKKKKKKGSNLNIKNFEREGKNDFMVSLSQRNNVQALKSYRLCGNKHEKNLLKLKKPQS